MGDAYENETEAEADRAQGKALRSTRVELEPIGLTQHGRRYRVTYAGETLVEGRRNPIFDACRVLLARGITGRLEVWRRGKTSADMQLDIEQGALFAIRETATESLRLVPWKPLPPHTGAASSNAFPYRRAQPPAAICASPVGVPTPERMPAPGVSATEQFAFAKKPRCEARLEENIALGDRQPPDTHPGSNADFIPRSAPAARAHATEEPDAHR
jgi:hypothetical protein